MKAAVLYANEDIRYSDISMPETKKGMVKIKVAVSGICGSDIPRVLSNGAHFYPIVLGHEFSGTVCEVGEGVTSVTVGDRVAGVPLLPCMTCKNCLNGWYSLCKNYSFIGSRQQGSFAEYIVVPHQNVVKFSNNVSFVQGAMFEPSTVALHGLRINNYCGGKTVAILGGGTIGLFTMQWANIMGASKTVVFDIDDERLALASEMGAGLVVNTNKVSQEQITKLNNESGFDFIFETAGQPDTMRLAFKIAANKANLCFIGTPSIDLKFHPDVWELMNRKEFNLTGSWMSYSAPFPGSEWTMTSEYFADGRLKIDNRMIKKCYPLENALDAFNLFKTPEKVRGKLLLLSDCDAL